VPRPSALTAPPVLALALALALSGLPAASQAPATNPQDAGAYLAAREAGFARDNVRAVPFLERLLAARPDDAAVRERLIVALMAQGNFPRAADLARALSEAAPGNAAGLLAGMAQGFAQGDYPRVLALTQAIPNPAPLDNLAAAWAHLGQGRMTEAQAVIDTVSTQSGMGPFALYCRALMLALVGDAEGALDILQDPAVQNALNRRGTLAHVQLLGLAARFDEAIALIDSAFPGATDPELSRLRTAYAAGQTLPFDIISSAADGMAEVYAVMAGAMRGPQQQQDALIYAQAALAINPRLTDALIVVGQILEDQGHPDLAAAAYARVGSDDAFALVAAVGRANTLEAQGRADEAIEVLQAAVERDPASRAAPQLLGDALRRASRHLEAIPAYTRALELHQAAGLPIDWRLWFARAVAYERTGQWPLAEADFRAALEIEPNQPTVLNYLGYSLVERREKLDEALEMIERAVAAEPDSGYIVDSLAWALFRLGRYAEALPHMERAVSLMPTDPILNDHLGDVFWAVGRDREARFQWRRALSFGPHDDLDMDRVRRKLEVGLDQVLIEEGAPPLHPDR
jgi:tetratricopeptide (TPR) repeat protein